MMFILLVALLTLIELCGASLPSSAHNGTGEPVSVYACDFTDCSIALGGYTVSVVETNETFTTDGNGLLSLFYPVGQQLTFVLQGDFEYRETQSATVFVPEGGLSTNWTQVVVQVPSNAISTIFTETTNGKKEKSKCQVVVTVCNTNVTIWDFPQGLPGTEAHFHPSNASTYTYYFGTWGKYSNDTNPLPNNLTSCSYDGGVLFENVPPDPEKLYTVTASKDGYTFSSTTIRCLDPGRFVNGAPNQGPRVVSGPSGKLR